MKSLQERTEQSMAKFPQFYIVKCSREGEDSQLHSPVISRLGEIYLNRAEAYAKLGEYDKALTDLNTIRNGHSLTRDYPGPHNQHEEVKASDYRVTYYIPQNAINAYPGTLTQNPTDNSGVILK